MLLSSSVLPVPSKSKMSLCLCVLPAHKECIVPNLALGFPNHDYLSWMKRRTMSWLCLITVVLSENVTWSSRLQQTIWRKRKLKIKSAMTTTSLLPVLTGIQKLSLQNWKKPRAQLTNQMSELGTGSAAEKMKHDHEKSAAIFSHRGAPWNVKQLRRLGSVTGRLNGSRSLLVICNDTFTRNFVLKLASALKTFPENGVFISPMLSPGDAKPEQSLLITRRKLIEDGTTKEDARLRDLELFKRVGNKWEEVAEMSVKAPNDEWLRPAANASSHCLHICLFNVRSLLNSNRRFAFGSSILKEELDALCLTETWLTEAFSNSELLLTDFIIHRCDRPSSSEYLSSHGGVLIRLRKTSRIVQCKWQSMELKSLRVWCL